MKGMELSRRASERQLMSIMLISKPNDASIH